MSPGMKLFRRIETPYGAFGEVYHEHKRICYSLEQNYRNNQRFISSVPKGKYALEQHDSKKFGKTVALVNTELDVYHYKHSEGRYAILVHPANIVDQLQGCIALGKSLFIYKNRWAIGSSAIAVQEFLKFDPVEIEIC